MSSVYVVAGAVVAGVLFIIVVYLAYVAHSLRGVAVKLQHNYAGRPRRTVAEDDAKLAADERALITRKFPDVINFE
eukprot:m.430662 g.430662  ORF g.430662 m.430662 type:complete len:76 (-) comp20240_c7_seq1:82-309(-)